MVVVQNRERWRSKVLLLDEDGFSDIRSVTVTGNFCVR
jgi:hypothetical protein